MMFFHPVLGLRQVKPDYWYTSAHLGDLGSAWKEQDRDKHLCFITQSGAIDTVANVSENLISSKDDEERIRSKEEIAKVIVQHIVNSPSHQSIYPLEVMCFINEGNNHWTSLAMQFTISGNELQIRAGYADSLDMQEDKVSQSASEIVTQIARDIKKQFNQYIVTSEIKAYQNRWKQRDYNSCGPYAFENAYRFLQDDRTSTPPKIDYIRTKHFAEMSAATAMYCSQKTQLLNNNLSQDIQEHVNNDSTLTAFLQYWRTQDDRNIDDIIKEINDQIIDAMICAYAQDKKQNAEDIKKCLKKIFYLDNQQDHMFSLSMTQHMQRQMRAFDESRNQALQIQTMPTRTAEQAAVTSTLQSTSSHQEQYKVFQHTVIKSYENYKTHCEDQTTYQAWKAKPLADGKGGVTLRFKTKADRDAFLKQLIQTEKNFEVRDKQNNLIYTAQDGELKRVETSPIFKP